MVRKKPVTKVTGIRINKTLKNLAIREIIYIYMCVCVCGFLCIFLLASSVHRVFLSINQSSFDVFLLYHNLSDQILKTLNIPNSKQLA